MKPLKDWTLGEVQEECKKRDNNCYNCLFLKRDTATVKTCKLKCNFPYKWELLGTPGLTPDELVIIRKMKQEKYYKAVNCGNCVAFYRDYRDGKMSATIPSILFPSLSDGDELDLTTMKLE